MSKTIRIKISEEDKERLTRISHSLRKDVVPFGFEISVNEVFAIYRIEGMSGIGLRSYDVYEILSVVERIFLMIEELKDYLIFPEKTVLSLNNIFIDEKMERTSLAYIPIDYEVSEKKNVSYLLMELKEKTDEQGKAYLDFFIAEYMSMERGIYGVLSLIEALKREARLAF